MTKKQKTPFWENTPLDQMSQEEWESLCDGCGRCCLQKLEDEDSGEVVYTHLVCHIYDMEKNCCSDYPNRHKRVPRCVKLTPQLIGEFHWLPSTCTYRILSEGGGLPLWHPLINSDPKAMQLAGIFISGKVLPEQIVAEDEWEEHVIHWVN